MISTTELKPPVEKFELLKWIQKNLFDGWLNASLTLISSLLIYLLLSSFLGWALGEANWRVVPANLKLFMTGVYPLEHIWRPWAVLGLTMVVMSLNAGTWGGVLRKYIIGTLIFFALFALLPLPTARLWLSGTVVVSAAAMALSWNRHSWQIWTLLSWVIAFPVMLEILLGVFSPLSTIPTQNLSGLMLTLILAAAALTISFPIGVLLALGRSNKNLPVVQVFCTLVIEIIRGVPLTTLLFAAWLLVPLFIGVVSVDLLVRASVGFILFTAVYVAEDIRGGLQAVSRGQVEAARAVGLNPFQITLLIVLPQALRAAVPAIVGEFLTLFKDTSLVFIIGMTDILGSARTVYTNPAWLGTHKEVLAFVGLVYFIFCYGMAYAAKQVEKNLGLGQR